MSQLPSNWEFLKLQTIATLKTGPFGSALHKADYIAGGIPLINPTHVKDGKLFPSADISVSPETAQRLTEYRLNAGDIVMGRRGEMGRCAVVPEYAQNWICGTGSVIVKSTPAINPRYLQKFLTAPGTVATLIGDSVGSTMVNLNQGVLLGLDIPLAPLAEQKRIADKLDSVLARVDACRDRLDRLPALLKRFRQSILAAATSGKLTEDWGTEKQSNRRSTPLKTSLLSIKTGPFGSTLHKSDYVLNCIPIINPMHIVDGCIIPSPSMTVDSRTAERLADFKLSEGDVVIGRRGEMGRCAVVTKNEDGWLCGTGSMILKPSRLLESKYLQLFLSSPETVTALEGESVGSTMVNLNQKILLGLDIYLPTVEEQLEIVRRVETLFAFADRLEARLSSARAQVDKLTPALLAKAFRGELVPQDPADEPASELLKRLSAARADAPKPKRGRSAAR